jgi:hypothetical protein
MPEVVYAAHTRQCTYLLDGDGVCRWVLSRHGSPTDDRCVGAQFVASIDPALPGSLSGELRVGVSLLFVRAEGGRFVLLRTREVQRVDQDAAADDDAPTTPNGGDAHEAFLETTTSLAPSEQRQAAELVEEARRQLAAEEALARSALDEERRQLAEERRALDAERAGWATQRTEWARHAPPAPPAPPAPSPAHGAPVRAAAVPPDREERARAEGARAPALPPPGARPPPPPPSSVRALAAQARSAVERAAERSGELAGERVPAQAAEAPAPPGPPPARWGSAFRIAPPTASPTLPPSPPWTASRVAPAPAGRPHPHPGDPHALQAEELEPEELDPDELSSEITITMPLYRPVTRGQRLR